MIYQGELSKETRGHNIEAEAKEQEQSKLQAELQELDGVIRGIEVEVNYLTDRLCIVLLPERIMKATGEDNTKEQEQSELLGVLKEVTKRASEQRANLYLLRSRIEL